MLEVRKSEMVFKLKGWKVNMKTEIVSDVGRYKKLLSLLKQYPGRYPFKDWVHTTHRVNETSEAPHLHRIERQSKQMFA